MDIVLVRHAESIWNAENRWQGQTDVPLSERGRTEAARLGERLGATPFDRRFASDLCRAHDTARAVGGEIETRTALREMDLGAWGGLLHEEILERFPEELAAMIEERDEPIGGGESLPRFEERARRALDEVIAASPAGGRVLVVTHGGVVRAIVRHLLGTLGRRAIVGCGNTAVTHLRHGPEGLRLVSYNCTAHLEPRPEREGSEVVLGPEAVARTAAHLGVPGLADRLVPPPPGARTRLVPGALHSFGVPALAGGGA